MASPKRRRLELPPDDPASLKIDDKEVSSVTSPRASPYKWICSLVIKSVTGKTYEANGFRICFPGAIYVGIVTCAHCIYVDGCYAEKVTIQFPGEKNIEVESKDLYVRDEYIASKDCNEDYGLILLPESDNFNDGLCWSAILQDNDLEKCATSVCGFSSDKPQGTMWVTEVNIIGFTDTKLCYTNNTLSIQSGSPIFIMENKHWTVVGINHGYKGFPGSAVRFSIKMISNFAKQLQRPKAIESFAFPNVYIRCDPKETGMHTSVGGRVNCQYSKPQQLEKFYIYPLEVQSDEKRLLIVIESVKTENVFIRMDGSSIKQYEPPGAGKVNCKYGAGESEMFYLKKEEHESYSFQNKLFPNRYIRLDGRGVNSATSKGSGVVNCQYYEDGDAGPNERAKGDKGRKNPPNEWEYFRIISL